MKLIVGLGNPGRKYKKTRHNAGFMFVDRLGKDLHCRFTVNRSFNCEEIITRYDGNNIIIIKPQTYMNASGQAVFAVMSYYKIPIEDILIIYDDKHLPKGKIRIRRGGSSGGHKGMENIIDALETTDIKRLRIGIGEEEIGEACDYVLSPFSKDEMDLIEKITDKAREMIEDYLTDNFENFMGKYN